jgi:ADP-L-glycero-D-manno-heptose 6-epimerase
MILLTGGAGFIGSNILRALNESGRTDVIVADDLTDGTKCANLTGRAFADYIDAGDLDSRLPTLPGLSAIIHQAAQVDTTAKDGRQAMAVNYTLSRRLLDVACRHGCPFIYASSAAVYGQGDAGFREEPACERPRTPYAVSKWAFDEHVRRLLPDPGIRIVGLRYFNVYGPCEHHKGRMASVGWHCFHSIRRGEPPRIFEGSAGYVRDFVYVGDVAAINLFFMSNATPSGIYNVGTGIPRSFADMGTIASRVAGGAPPVEIPFPQDLVGQYQKYTCADLTRLRKAGWRHDFTSLEDGLAAYWRQINS